ncbi:DUF2842 domain-containing protein [Paracoccus sp. (in: a-proteobacteria)]|uniref:DUF2842 domain-containing protein n=1 Tax=Paracoccus sp. TaxID=267 RepID=UPI0035B07E22
MSMDVKSRKRWSLVILLIGLPLYLAAAWFITGLIFDLWGRMPLLLELVVYVGLGVIWILPFRKIFSGIGKAE